MKLKILSTIAAISATATSASSLTCGDVQALYQDGACCSANGQSCVKSLSIAANSSGFTTLSNTGELNIDLTSITSATEPLANTIQIIDSNGNNDFKVAGETSAYGLTTDKQVLFRKGPDGKTLLVKDGETTFYPAATVNFNGAVNFNNALAFNDYSRLGRDAHKSSEFLPPDIGHYCVVADQPADYAHGFKSVWNQNWPHSSGSIHSGGWEMRLEAGDFTPYSFACLVRQVVLGNAELHTLGKIYGEQFLVPSDSRIKKDIVDADIEDALQKVRDIELKEYSYNDPNREGEKTVGFIAQQVKEVYPNAIKIDIRNNTMHNEAGERVEIPDLHRVNKDKIFALHHGALQSLDAKIAALEALDAKIAALEARLAALEPQPTPEEPQPTPEA